MTTDPKALIERLLIDNEDCRTGARVRKAYETLCHERHLAAQALRDLTAENTRLKALGGDGGFVVANGAGTSWRRWSQFGCIWTKNIELATRYHRREDAEAVHEGDEDAWAIIPYSYALAAWENKDD